MSKWAKVKLDNICANKIQTVSPMDNFDIEYVDISSIDNQEKKIVSYQTMNSREAPSRAKQLLNKDDILVSTVRPNLNAVAMNRIKSGNKIVGSTGFCVLRCNSDIDVNYVFNFCKSKAFINTLVKIAKGASYPAVSNSDVRNSKIPLPPLETQKIISKTLDTVTELLTMRKQQLAELDNLIKSTFYYMFGDPVINDKRWWIRRLSEVSTLKSGGTPSRSQPEYFVGKIPWITTVSLGKTFIDENDATEFINEDAIENSATKLIKENSLLFGVRVGVGKISINKVPLCINQDILAIVDVDSFLLDQVYLLNTINSYANYFNEQKRGATIKGIKTETVGSIDIPIPPLDKQILFSKIVTKIEEQKALVKKAIDETQYLFDSLMSQYFD